MDDIEKRYYRIRDVSELVNVPASTLRFWEKEFDCLNPRRSATNLRYYTPEDIRTLRIISFLLRDKGLKLEAAKEEMRTNRKGVEKRLMAIDRLESIKKDLEHLREALSIRAQRLNIPMDDQDHNHELRQNSPDNDD